MFTFTPEAIAPGLVLGAAIFAASVCIWIYVYVKWFRHVDKWDAGGAQ